MGGAQEAFSSCEASGSHRNASLGTGWLHKLDRTSSEQCCSLLWHHIKEGDFWVPRQAGAVGLLHCTLHISQQGWGWQRKGTAAERVSQFWELLHLKSVCWSAAFSLPKLGCGHEGAWVGLGSGWDMKLCPSTSRAGIATFPLSNDKFYELWVRAGALCGWIDVEITLCLITHSTELFFVCCNRVCFLQGRFLPGLEQ